MFTPRPLPALLPLAALLCAAGMAYAQQDARQYEFALPAAALEQTLGLIAAQTGQGVAADPLVVRGRQAAAVNGAMTAGEALRRALAGTQLQAVQTPTGWVVRPMPAVPAAAATAAAAAADGTRSLETVTITASPTAVTAPYMADRPSSVATKSSLAPRLTPFSVNQADADLIVERGDQNIYETLERFSGVTSNNGQADIGINVDRYLDIRGFRAAGSNTGQMLINGQRTFGSGGGMRGSDSLEAVELLRGPASIYYGAAEPGGVFNYNYKRPKAQAAYVLRGRVDSEGSRSLMADLTGPLNADASLRYRLVGSFAHNEDDQAKVWSHPHSLLAALQFKPNGALETTLTYERTDFTAVPEKENNKRHAGGSYYPIPASQSFLGQTNDRAERTGNTLILDAVWKPSDAFKLLGSINYQDAEQWYQATRPSGSGGGGTPPAPIDGHLVPRAVSFAPGSQWRNFSASLDASGELHTGQWKHEWLVGGGWGEGRSRSKSRPSVSGEFDSGGYVSPRNNRAVAAGRYAPDPLDLDTLQNGYWRWRDVVMAQSAYMVPWASRKDASVYAQNLIHLPDRKTRLMLGMGWSQYDNLARGAYNWTTGKRGKDTAHKTSKWTPRLAVMRDITPTATVYASYGRSYAPQSSLTLTDSQGNPLLTPQAGVQYEVGYKQDFNNGQGMFTASLFRIDKKNIARAANSDSCDSSVTDVADPHYCYYALDGLQRSQGVELSLSGQITASWAASINYTYLDTEIVKTADVWQRGRSFASVPRHSVSAWNKVRLSPSVAQGTLSLGVGLRAQSDMHTSYTRTGATTLPGYGVVDLGLFWQRNLKDGQKLSVNLNLNNAFNREVFVGSSAKPSGTLIYGPARRLALTAQYSF